MAYQALNEKSVTDYIKNRPAMERIFSRDARLSAQEVGDGNLNLVFIIENEDDSQQSAVVKQALPYLRVAGDSWPLTRERMRFETQALLLENELAPGLVPEVYDHDSEMSLVIMEYLSRLGGGGYCSHTPGPAIPALLCPWDHRHWVEGVKVEET